jgi:hypothetical protein
MKACLGMGMLWLAMVSWALAARIPAGEVEALRAALVQARPGDLLVLANGEWCDVALVVEAEGAADVPIPMSCATSLPGPRTLIQRNGSPIPGRVIGMIRGLG